MRGKRKRKKNKGVEKRKKKKKKRGVEYQRFIQGEKVGSKLGAP